MFSLSAEQLWLQSINGGATDLDCSLALAKSFWGCVMWLRIGSHRHPASGHPWVCAHSGPALIWANKRYQVLDSDHEKMHTHERMCAGATGVADLSGQGLGWSLGAALPRAVLRWPLCILQVEHHPASSPGRWRWTWAGPPALKTAASPRKTSQPYGSGRQTVIVMDSQNLVRDSEC